MMPVGRVIGVAKSSANKEAAYWVAKHISYDTSLENVSSSLTGLDPYRTIHFTNPQAYAMFPSEAEAQNYLKGVEAAMADGYPEIFIPGAAQYQDSLDLHVNKALTGQKHRSKLWMQSQKNGMKLRKNLAGKSRLNSGQSSGHI